MAYHQVLSLKRKKGRHRRKENRQRKRPSEKRALVHQPEVVPRGGLRLSAARPAGHVWIPEPTTVDRQGRQHDRGRHERLPLSRAWCRWCAPRAHGKSLLLLRTREATARLPRQRPPRACAGMRQRDHELCQRVPQPLREPCKPRGEARWTCFSSLACRSARTEVASYCALCVCVC